MYTSKAPQQKTRSFSAPASEPNTRAAAAGVPVLTPCASPSMLTPLLPGGALQRCHAGLRTTSSLDQH